MDYMVTYLFKYLNSHSHKMYLLHHQMKMNYRYTMIHPLLFIIFTLLIQIY